MLKQNRNLFKNIYNFEKEKENNEKHESEFILRKVIFAKMRNRKVYK